MSPCSNATEKRAAVFFSDDIKKKWRFVFLDWKGGIGKKTYLTKEAKTKTKTNGATMQQSRAEITFLGIPDLFGHQSMNEKEIDARKEKK